MIVNYTEAINAINPLYISGAADSWVTDLVWDRVMRIGPDGLPRRGGRSVTWVDAKTVDVELRSGMTWHDGKPVTVEDVIFSYQATSGDKAPMYKPFVTDIASIEKTGARQHALQAEGAERLVPHSTLAKINLIPKHIWEPILTGIAGKPENAESLPGAAADRLGSVQGGALQAARRRSCWRSTPITGRGAEDGSLDPAHRAQHRGERSACCGAARSTSSRTIAATPKMLDEVARQQKDIRDRPDESTWAFASWAITCAVRRSTTSISARRCRRHQPQPDGAGGMERLRGAGQLARLAGAAVLVQGRGRTTRETSKRPRSCCKKAGYELVGGKLHYPDGKKEKLATE